MPHDPLTAGLRVEHLWSWESARVRGGRVRARGLPFWVLIAVRLGANRITVGDGARARTVTVGPGELAAIPPFAPHRIVDLDDPVVDAVHVRVAGMAGLDPLAGFVVPSRLGGAAGRRASRRLRAFARAHGSATAGFVADLARHRSGLDLLAELVAASEPAASDRRRASALAALGPLLELIDRRLDRPPGRRELARHAGLSPSGLAALFRRGLGEAPLTYIRRRRLRRAAELLASPDRPVGDVAAMVGFADPFHFSRAFKREFGLPPLAFQRRAGLGSH